MVQWLRCCATNLKVAGSIPAGVSGFFIDIKSFRSHYGPGVDSASNRNEYQEYFLVVKAAGAQGWQPYHHPVPLSRNLGALTSWNPLGLSRPVTGLLYLFTFNMCRSLWSRGLRRRSAAARLLRSWVRIPPGAWMFVCCVVCVCCQVEVSDHSSIGVLPTVMHRCVWSRNFKNEEAMARVGLQRHGGEGGFNFAKFARSLKKLSFILMVEQRLC